MLEEAMAACQALSPVVPGWLCGRLAALYRTLGRLDDEVQLLERYRDSQTDDDARTRYDARLSKARTLAERQRRSESGALISIRRSMGIPRLRATADEVRIAMDVPLASVARLAALLHGRTDAEFDAVLDESLLLYCAEMRALEIPLHRMVDGLRQAWREAVPDGVSTERARQRYSASLVRLLSLHFNEDGR